MTTIKGVEIDSEPERPHVGGNVRIKSKRVEDTGKVSCRWTKRKVSIEDALCSITAC